MFQWSVPSQLYSCEERSQPSALSIISQKPFQQDRQSVHRFHSRICSSPRLNAFPERENAPLVSTGTSSPAASQASTLSRSSSPPLSRSGSATDPTPPRSRTPLFYTARQNEETRKCGSCSAILDHDSEVCEICGTELETPAPSKPVPYPADATHRCGTCEAVADPGSTVCEICGESVRAPFPVGGSMQQPTWPSRLELLYREEMRKSLGCECKSCGAILDRTATQCEICGESTRWATGTLKHTPRMRRAVTPVEPFDKEKMKPVVWGLGELQFKIGSSVRKVQVPVLQRVGGELVPASGTGGQWL